MYTWNRCGIVPIHQLIHWLPWALRYTPPKAAGHSGQTDCASPKRRGTQGKRAVSAPKRWGSGRTGCVSAKAVGTVATHRRRAPIRPSRADAGDARALVIPAEGDLCVTRPVGDSVAEMPGIPSGEPPNLDSRLRGNDGCAKVSGGGNPSPGIHRPNHPFTPSSADASAARIEGRA